MGYQELIGKEGYYLSFQGFEQTKGANKSLTVRLDGNPNETELLIGDPQILERWQISFSSYAFYSATFEDFTVAKEHEVYQGYAFRIYEKSDLMDRLRTDANLEVQEKNRGKIYRHYSFACMEHQVDVVSCDEPSTKMLCSYSN